MSRHGVGLIAAFGVALAGQGLIAAGAGWPGAVALVAGWGWWYLVQRRDPSAESPAPGSASGRELAVVALLTALAAAARFTARASAPPGLLLDEARMGLLASALLRGEDPRPWLHSTEILGMLPTTIAFAVAGPTVGALRAVPALWGTLTVPALWWASRPLIGPVPALAAAGALAALRWHVELSRLAFSVVQLPLFVILSVGCLLRARPGGWRWLALSGAAAGLAVHTYAAGRPVPLIALAVFAAWALSAEGRLSGRERWECASGWLAGFAAGFGVAGWYLLWHPEWFLGRIGEVGAVLPGAGAAAMNFVHGLGAVNVRTFDLVHTYPAPGGSPLAGIVAGACWVPGLFLVARSLGGAARVGLGAWLVVGFAGALFEGPHGMRMFMLAPLVAAGTGMALVSLVRAVPVRLVAVSAVVLGLCHGGGELWRYARGPYGGVSRQTVEWVFRVPERHLAERICAEAGKRPVYLGPDAVNPAGTPLEWWASSVLFLSSRCVSRGPIPDPAVLARQQGMVLFLVVSRSHLDLLHEILPGGEVWTGLEADPGQPADAAYAAGAESVRRARVPLGEMMEMFAGLREMEKLVREGRPVDAAVVGDRLAARWPGIGGIQTARASVLGSAGRVSEVEGAARAAIKAGAQGGLAWLYLGMSLMEQRMFSAAAEAFARCTAEAPDLEDGWAGLVTSLANAGRRKEALLRLEEARLRFPGSAQLTSIGAQLR